MVPAIGMGRRRSFQRRVLGWYALNGRALPWRNTRDPYAILVSELLSHQTQIARVLPVYERLLKRYPSIQELAQAPLADVKAITDPLGYMINQALMDLGALVCKARVPRCSVCPLWRSCAFRRKNQAGARKTPA